MPTRTAPAPAPAATRFEDAYPNSRKIYLDGRHGVRVPLREIALAGGEPPLRVYDTSGPQGSDVRAGLPKLRRDWVLARGDVEQTGRADARGVPDALAHD